MGKSCQLVVMVEDTDSHEHHGTLEVHCAIKNESHHQIFVDSSFTGVIDGKDRDALNFVDYHIAKIRAENRGRWHPIRAERYVLLLTVRMRMKYESAPSTA